MVEHLNAMPSCHGRTKNNTSIFIAKTKTCVNLYLKCIYIVIPQSLYYDMKVLLQLGDEIF
jgi:hypothetical protein